MRDKQLDVGSFDPNQYKYLCSIFFSISLFHLLLCLEKLLFDLIDKFWKNFKVLILLLKPIHPLLVFVQTLKHSAARYQQLVSELALIVIQIFRKWLDKIKLLLRVHLSTYLLYLLVKTILSGKLGCKFFWNLLIEVFGMLC